MVDQLWMWILGKDLVVTSFPQRWQQPKNDPLNVLDGIIEDINSKSREPVRSVFDLAMTVTSRCSGAFDRHAGDAEFQFLDMFESSIGSATDRETVLFKEFNAASAQASAWLRHRRRPNRFSRERLDAANCVKSETFTFDDFHKPLFVDKLLDIGQETDLLAEMKDIRDELHMLGKVLEDQKQVLPDLELAMCEIYLSDQAPQREIKKRFRDQLKTIEMHVKDINRMDKQAEHIYYSITDLLDLKQKHANAFEARFARDQAAGTARQSQTIMVFTIVTIIFLPLSFIGTFFTINIREFPQDESGQESLPLAYVLKYMFGVGFAISIPLIFVALSLDDIADLAAEGKRRWISRKQKNWFSNSGHDPAGVDGTLGLQKFETVFAAARRSFGAGSRSIETDVLDGGLLLPVVSKDTARATMRAQNSAANDTPHGNGNVVGVRANTGFRMRSSRDMERGA
jgi:Mg2+ and Co2+ transporter CorA